MASDGAKRPVSDPSADTTSLRIIRTTAIPVDEQNFTEIETAMLYVEKARSRAERAAEALRQNRAEPHLVEAMEEAERDLSELARRLRQNTYFAVPSAQTSL
jgi:hypothetical protein